MLRTSRAEFTHQARSGVYEIASSESAPAPSLILGRHAPGCRTAGAASTARRAFPSASRSRMMASPVSRSCPMETIRAMSMRRPWGVWRRRVFFFAGMAGSIRPNLSYRSERSGCDHDRSSTGQLEPERPHGELRADWSLRTRSGCYSGSLRSVLRTETRWPVCTGQNVAHSRVSLTVDHSRC